MSRDRTDEKNRSTGQGKAGMGGDPGDDPRDRESGGARADEDRDIRQQPVPGAFGAGGTDKQGGTSTP